MNTQQQKKFKILLIGDSCVDEYIYGTCDRLNPEAPVPVLKITRSTKELGMAANVKKNIEAFNCDVDFITGSLLSVKRRYIDDRSKQHIVRVDEDYINSPFEPKDEFTGNQYDAVVISDYNKGFVSYETIQSIQNMYNGPIFIDTKKTDLIKFNKSYVKINELEFNNSISKCENLIVTLGNQGAMYKGKMFSTDSVSLVDVCGAGDTFLASLTYQYLLSKDMDKAIQFANKCAAISVQHRGVYTLTQNDIDSIKF